MADSETDNAKECNDCGKPFPLRQASGNCAKCIKLCGHARDSAEYQEIFVYIKSDIVKAVNIEWTQQTLVPLEDTPSNAPIYLHNVPKKWKHLLKTAKNSPFICLELYVHYDVWLLRKEAIENQEMLPSTSRNYSSKTDDITGRKRGRTESSKNVAAPKNKQIRPLAGGGVLSSEFSRRVLAVGSALLQLLAIQHELNEELLGWETSV
ncbi:hypothetical protein B0H14DRAFT_2593722 [Mycena olivaceomarginata]|nr:hypothetical protein B0H14DRAFT_2593722 [Mycena olivaceomarginata]